MKFDIISIFPEFFQSPLAYGVLRAALQKNIICVNITNPRDYTKDGVVDDYQFGGGAGMVFKPEPVTKAVKAVSTKKSMLINLTPKGKRLNQKIVNELTSRKHIIIICSRYKGIDERINEIFQPLNISVGDYVISGGEIGALILMEAVTRLLPGVLGNRDSAESDSFQGNLLEAPIYTRPHVFKKLKVPHVLRSGNHNRIAEWRRKKTMEITLARKPDLFSEETFSKKDFEILLEVLNGENS